MNDDYKKAWKLAIFQLLEFHHLKFSNPDSVGVKIGNKFSRQNIDLDSFDIGEDFLDWSYYNRQDRKRH